METIWKSIKGYEGLYEVSNTGDVRNAKTGQLKSQREKVDKSRNTSNRYKVVSLYSNGKRVDKTVHILVAKSFIPNPENKPEVNHKDGIKKNNFVYNLEWATSSENIQHSFDIGFRDSKNGEKHGYRKIMPEIKRTIQEEYRTRKYSRLELANKFSISLPSIDKIIY